MSWIDKRLIVLNFVTKTVSFIRKFQLTYLHRTFYQPDQRFKATSPWICYTLFFSSGSSLTPSSSSSSSSGFPLVSFIANSTKIAPMTQPHPYKLKQPCTSCVSSKIGKSLSDTNAAIESTIDIIVTPTVRICKKWQTKPMKKLW